MRFPLVRSRFFLVPALSVMVAAAVAACSSSPSPGTNPPATVSATSAAPSASAGGSSSAAVTEIKTNWEAFFSPKTPAAKRISLLQNGQAFASVIKAQSGSSLASSASAAVSSVTVTSPTQAKVTYSVLLGGTPALKNQPGVAVLQNGIWKVGNQSFCALLTMENNGKAPSVCSSAG